MARTMTEVVKICEDFTDAEAKDLLRMAVACYGHRVAVTMFNVLVRRCSREAAISTVIDLLYAGIIPKYSPVAIIVNRRNGIPNYVEDEGK